MPYKSLKDANPAIRGITPPVTLAQANTIAEWADAMEQSNDPPESPWGAAISQFKKLYFVKDGAWHQRAEAGELGEAATTKTAAQRLMRDCEMILTDKALPVSLRKEIDDVRVALRRKWSDLEADADGENDEEPEEAAIMPNESKTVISAAAFDVDGKSVPIDELMNVYRMHEAEEGEREKARKAQEARSKRYGISVVEGGNVTKPGDFSRIADDDFGDPVNYAYPADRGHARAALGYFNRDGQREDGGYSEADWAAIGKRLATLIGRAMDADYEYSGGKLARKKSEEVYAGLSDFTDRVRSAFHATFRKEEEGGYYGPYVLEVYLDHPVFGTAVICDDQGEYYHAPFTDAEGVFTFSDPEGWRRVVRVYQFIGTPEEPQPEAPPEGEPEPGEAPEMEQAAEVAEFSESAEDSVAITGRALDIAEVGDVATGGSKPLILRVVPIRPGWGNERDNYYYSREALHNDSQRVFQGVKMFETNHRPEETNNRTWVSTIIDTAEFTDDGAPISRVGVHDPTFAQKVLNLVELERTVGKPMLPLLECSIRGSGSVRKGVFEEGGRKGKYITALGEMSSVDWVSKAGAGGRALGLAESEDGGVTMPEPEQENVENAAQTEQAPLGTEQPAQESAPEVAPVPVRLAEAEVTAALDAVPLPQRVKALLAGAQYETAQALQEAIDGMVDDFKASVGSGKLVATRTQAATPKPLDRSTIEEAQASVNRRYLIDRNRTRVNTP